MTAYKKRAAPVNDDDVRRMEAFERPAVKAPAITQPGDAGSIDDVGE